MRTLFTLLLTATVLLHATLGCCWHHVHAEGLGCGESHAAGIEAVCEHHAHGHVAPAATATDGDVVQRPPVDHGHHGCDDGKCSFARTEISTDTKVANSADFPAIFAQPCCCLPQPAQIADRSHAPACNVSSGDLRLHLALAVLLI